MNPEEVLKEIENNKDSFMVIGPKKGKVLADLVKTNQPKNVLEIGTNLGYSSILMGLHLPQRGQITTLELQPKSAARAQENFKKANFEDKINVVIGDARETLPSLSGPFDFVFIDAAKKQYFTYLNLIENKLTPGAIIVADNVGLFKDEMEEYLKYVRKSGKYESQTIQVGNDAIEVSMLTLSLN